MNRSTSKWQIPGFLGLAKLTAGLSVFVLLLSALSSAQSTGQVTGTVTDQSGAVVAKAKVTLVNEDTKFSREITSNDSGSFTFAALLPGTYTLKVSAPNFKSLERKGIALRAGDFQNVRDLALTVGVTSDVVEVVGAADIISPSDTGEHSITLTAKTIANLSLEGRDATELIKTLPGFAVFNGTGNPTNTSQDFGIVSPTSGAVGQGYVGNGAAYRGGTDLTSDGAHILDNGCNCGATQTVNGDMVAEVKVQTSNFGADSAKGPVVVNVSGKSGTQTYHGEAWMHARDGSLNSVDWNLHHQIIEQGSGTLLTAPTGRFLYPGGSVSGPIPHTNKKLVFYAGFEYYYQNQFPYQSGILEDRVPTMSMRGLSSTGALLPGGADFTTSASDNAAMCAASAGGNRSNPMCGNLTDIQPGHPDAWASGLTWSNATTGPGTTVNNSVGIPQANIDPGARVLLQNNNIPFPNANPSSDGGFNLLVPEYVDQNAWTLHPRVDYNINESTKLYVTYNMQKETDASPIHLWWTPPNSIPFPGGMSSKDNSQTLSGHFVKIINPTLTNDFSAGLGYINYPLMKNSKTAWDAAANNYPYKTLFGNPTSGNYGPTNSNMMPDISNGYWVTTGIPFMDQPDIFQNGGSFAWKKWNLSGEDTITKVYKTHSIKIGGYLEKSTNDQGAFTAINSEVGFAPFGPNNCATNPLKASNSVTNPSFACGSNNQVANLLLGVANCCSGGGFSQVNRSALDSLWYPTVSGYIQDDWKVTRRLTLNLGLRADHLGAWQPMTDAGVASWTGNFSGGGPNPNLPGITWHGFDSSIPLSGRDFNSITWQPRFGLAYDVLGTGKTILRGGWGAYGYRDQWNDYAGPADLAQGIVTFNSPGPVTLAQMNNTFGQAAGGVSSSATAVVYNDKYQPVSRNWNMTISQQLPWSSLFELSYIGSDTIHEVIRAGPENVNEIAPGAWFNASGCVAPCNVDTSTTAAIQAYTFGATPYGSNAINLVRHAAKANYNGLQAIFARQKGRFTFNANYTWSKTLGTQGQGGGAGSGNAPDNYNINNDYGVLSTDRSQIINTSYVLQTGNPFKGVLGYVANGWNLSGITVWQSGQDIPEIGNANLNLSVNNNILQNKSVTNGGGTTGTAGLNNQNWIGTPSTTLQPVVLCNPTAGLKTHEYFNPNCFGLSAAGANGQYQLPYMHGPAFFNSDLAVFKVFKINERQTMEFRFSAFNFLNHPLDSFQNNGDMTVTLHNTSVVGSTAFANTFVNTSQSALTGPYVLNGSNTIPGYASTKFGHRVLELSAKWSF